MVVCDQTAADDTLAADAQIGPESDRRKGFDGGRAQRVQERARVRLREAVAPLLGVERVEAVAADEPRHHTHPRLRRVEGVKAGIHAANGENRADLALHWLERPREYVELVLLLLEHRRGGAGVG